MKVLGITANNRVSATDHVSNLLSSCSSLLYTLRHSTIVKYRLLDHTVSRSSNRPISSDGATPGRARSNDLAGRSTALAQQKIKMLP